MADPIALTSAIKDKMAKSVRDVMPTTVTLGGGDSFTGIQTSVDVARQLGLVGEFEDISTTVRIVTSDITTAGTTLADENTCTLNGTVYRIMGTPTDNSQTWTWLVLGDRYA